MEVSKRNIIKRGDPGNLFDLGSNFRLQMDILEFLTNPLILFAIAIPTFIFIGIQLGVWLSSPRKNRVIQVIPESGRATELEVDSEDTINVYCPAVGNTPPQRFIKRHQALNVVRKGLMKLQTYALWFGRQGTAYTYKVTGETGSHEPIKVPFREAVINILGKDLYEQLPNDEKWGHVKDQIEKSQIGVTVEFPTTEPLTPKNPNYDANVKDPEDPRSHEYLPSVSSDDIRRNDIDVFIGSLVRGIKSLTRGQNAGEWVKIVFILGSGVAIGIVLSLIFRWGAPVVIPNGGT